MISSKLGFFFSYSISKFCPRTIPSGPILFAKSLSRSCFSEIFKFISSRIKLKANVCSASPARTAVDSLNFL